MELNQLYRRNTNPKLYQENEYGTNCGSFALGVDKWYCPYIEEDDVDDDLWPYTEYERINWIEELVREGHDREEIMEDIIDRDFDFILMTCPWLEPISENEIDEKDRVIAYRLSMEIPNEREEFDVDEYMDFHFRVMIDGEWWEKNGSTEVHRVEDPSSWEVDDLLVYDGPIRYAKFRVEE
jgi:hypothetical protein